MCEQRVLYSLVNIELYRKIEEGRLLEESDSGKVLLGHAFLDMDDFGKEFRLGKKVLINGEEFEIIGFLAQSDTFTMILTRQELADMSAMAKESVVRILKEFSDEKIIDTSKQKFKIINRQKLDMICTNG